MSNNISKYYYNLNEYFKFSPTFSFFKLKKKGNNLGKIKLRGFNHITNLNYMFSGCNLLSSTSDFSKLDLSKVTDMSYMFSDSDDIEELPDISNWNTSKVTDMNALF